MISLMWCWGKESLGKIFQQHKAWNECSVLSYTLSPTFALTQVVWTRNTNSEEIQIVLLHIICLSKASHHLLTVSFNAHVLSKLTQVLCDPHLIWDCAGHPLIYGCSHSTTALHAIHFQWWKPSPMVKTQNISEMFSMSRRASCI